MGTPPPARALLDRPGGGARRNRVFARSSSLHVSIMDEQAVHRAVARMARELVEQNEGPDNLALLGIHRRGVQIADLIRSEIERAEGVTVPIGSLDITPVSRRSHGHRATPRDRRDGPSRGGCGRDGGGDRRRRTLHGPNRPGSPQRTHGLGPSGAGFALRTGGSGGERVSDPTQRCGKDHHRSARSGRGSVPSRISMAVWGVDIVQLSSEAEA